MTHHCVLALRVPLAVHQVFVDLQALSAFQQHAKIQSAHRPIPPPLVINAPALQHFNHSTLASLPGHRYRHAILMLHANRVWLVQKLQSTSAQRRSGKRDHGSTSMIRYSCPAGASPKRMRSWRAASATPVSCRRRPLHSSSCTTLAPCFSTSVTPSSATAPSGCALPSRPRRCFSAVAALATGSRSVKVRSQDE